MAFYILVATAIRLLINLIQFSLYAVLLTQYLMVFSWCQSPLKAKMCAISIKTLLFLQSINFLQYP